MVDWGKIFNIEMVLINAIGILLTIFYMDLGEYSIGIGMLRLDLYYAFIFLFLSILLWSIVSLWKQDRK